MKPTPMPSAWSDLIEGITMLAQHPADTISPFYCSHDTLHVLADETAFTSAEIERRALLGFNVDLRAVSRRSGSGVLDVHDSSRRDPRDRQAPWRGLRHGLRRGCSG